MTHKFFNNPSDDLYVPLQVGSAINKNLGYLRDDTGDNISDLNPYFGELTGFYWLWKNVTDVEIIGVCHYRRYFGKENKLLKTNDVERLISDCDIISSNIVETIEKNYRDDFASAHNINDLLLTGDAIKELYPDDYQAFLDMLEDNTHTYGNLIITRKKVFDEYCEWLFSIFSLMMDKLDFTGYDMYHMRLFGFLSENLIRVFSKSRGYVVKPGRVYVTEEKTETKELKQAIYQLIKTRKINEAREMLISYLKLRPDVMLPLSDISGELNILAEIVSINDESEYEEIYEHTGSINELIGYYKSMTDV